MNGLAVPPTEWWKTVSVAEMRDAEHVINTSLHAAPALSPDACERLARALAIHCLSLPGSAVQRYCLDAVGRLAQQARACMAADPTQWHAALQAARGGENIAEALGRALELAAVAPDTRAYAGVEACRLRITLLHEEMRTFAMRMPVTVKGLKRVRIKFGVLKV